MEKFVIECPSCGRYAEARSGFLARKRIECSCGHVIDVRMERMAVRECPHCGNEVVFDQAKGKHAKCPVCGEPINAMAPGAGAEEFTCAQCGVRLRANRGASTYTCPVCDCVNDVGERLAAARIKKEGLASVIRYEGDHETLVWKHPVEDFNLGSQLIVHESQEAIFFRDGQALDLFGAGRYTLETQQLPLLEKFYKLPTDTESTFHSEVYFISLATQMGIKWGTDSKVRLFDPASGLHLELGASGEFNIRVIDSRRLLIKVVGTADRLKQSELLGDGGNGFFRAMVMTQVKSYLAQAIRENSINVLAIDEHLMELSESLRDKINTGLADYGLTMPEFYISRIVTPDDDPNYRRLREQYAEQCLLVRQEQIRKSEAEAAQARKAVEAQTEARMKVIGAQGEAEALRIQRAAEADAYRMQAEAEAQEMRMKGFSYQQETARQVGMAAMQNGLTGNGTGAGGALGDVAGLGIAMGAMSGVMDMTKDAMGPILGAGNRGEQGNSAPQADQWNCACGEHSITTNFCPNCGAQRPAIQTRWNCAQCGTANITTNFCPNCGCKRPDEPSVWNCPNCGMAGITSNFCPNCGCKKSSPPQPDSWGCACGRKGITTQFCPDCGKQRGDKS